MSKLSGPRPSFHNERKIERCGWANDLSLMMMVRRSVPVCVATSSPKMYMGVVLPKRSRGRSQSQDSSFRNLVVPSLTRIFA